MSMRFNEENGFVGHLHLGERNQTTAWSDPDEEPCVKQSMRDECDINKIMERYRNGGELQHINKALGQYGDFSSGQDFTDAYTKIAKAEAAFAALPAHARDLMGNDPEVFLYKCQDPVYLAKFEQLGLYDPDAGVVVDPPKSGPLSASEQAPVPTENAGKTVPITGGE